MFCLRWRNVFFKYIIKAINRNRIENMSVRIHAVAKELGITSKELISFLQDRLESYDNLVVKSASSSIMPMYADMIKEDYLKSISSVPATQEPKNESKAPVEKEAQAEELVQATPVEVQAEETQDAPVEAEVVQEPVAEKIIEEEKVVEVVVPVAPVVEAKKPAPIVPPVMKKPAPIIPPVQAKPASVVPPVKRPIMPAPVAPKAASVPPVIPPRVGVKSPAALPPRPASAPSVPPMPARASSPSVPPMPARATSPSIPAMPPRVSSPAKLSMPARTAKPTEGEAQAEGEVAEIKNIQVKPPIMVRDFAKLIDLKPFRLISELMDMGIFAAMNQTLEENVAVKIAANHGYNLEVKHRGEQAKPKQKADSKPKFDDPKDLEYRAPIVCILGHVDHGKTTLLDTIRSTNVVAGEAGGITQHTAAYQVECNGKKITFLDTPGHAAFSKMRERGANVTDIAILVIAADDSFMPQTEEALAFAQKAGVPVIVAINKMDAKGANIDNVKRQMQAKGIAPEDWGGETLCCPVSALKATNINELLELVLLQAEIMELKANPKRPVEGTIIESQVEQGRGATSTLIVREGTLKTGDTIYCNEYYCRVRAIMDDKGKKIDKVLPGCPARVMGWNGAPEAGETFYRADNEKKARRITEEYITEKKLLENSAPEPSTKAQNIEELMAAIANKGKKTFKCIVKSDVSGTVEALSACLRDIKSDKVDLEIITEGVGQITNNDVDMASTSNASIVAFNVKLENGVVAKAKHKGVEIITDNIIYELLTKVKLAMKELLDPELKENILGTAEVRAVFVVSKFGRIAGSMVTDGSIKRDKFARVFRNKQEIAKGRVGTLKRFKDDATEVKSGYECGINVTGFEDYKEGDIVECFEILEIRPDL